MAEDFQVLVVDDDPLMGEVLQTRLEQWGYGVFCANSTKEALKLLEQEAVQLILTDVVMPDSSGLELLRQLMAVDGQRRVILMTGHGTVDMAVEAMKEGARDFITKPLDWDALRVTLRDLQQEIRSRREARKRHSEMSSGSLGFHCMIGDCRPMREVYEIVRRVADTDASVLITGESGTGKELVAAAIHENSGRAKSPFVPLNVAAIPGELMESELFGHEKGAFTGAVDQKPGCFEMAHEGTLFLDEIGEMPLALQPKLLRVLEDGKVRRVGGKKEFAFEVRVVAATNRDPAQAVQEGVLRQDLFYRLNVFHVELPPLRDRGDDLLLLSEHFLTLFNRKHGARVEGLRDATVEEMRKYTWPGNVRELRNALERAVVLAEKGWIEPGHLPAPVRAPEMRGHIVLPVGTPMEDAEKEVILRTYEETGGNKSQTARKLGLDVKTVRAKLKSYGVD